MHLFFSCRQKNDTWMKVENEFNTNAEIVHCTTIVLKNKYSNLKKRLLKKLEMKMMTLKVLVVDHMLKLFLIIMTK